MNLWPSPQVFVREPRVTPRARFRVGLNPCTPTNSCWPRARARSPVRINSTSPSPTSTASVLKVSSSSAAVIRWSFSRHSTPSARGKSARTAPRYDLISEHCDAVLFSSPVIDHSLICPVWRSFSSRTSLGSVPAAIRTTGQIGRERVEELCRSRGDLSRLAGRLVESHPR